MKKIYTVYSLLNCEIIKSDDGKVTFNMVSLSLSDIALRAVVEDMDIAFKYIERKTKMFVDSTDFRTMIQNEFFSNGFVRTIKYANESGIIQTVMMAAIEGVLIEKND